MPRRHVSMVTTSTAPKRIGIQPPCAIFRLLAARKVEAMTTNGPSATSAVQRRQCQQQRSTTMREQRVDDHRRRDRDAVGRGEVGRGLEEQRQQHDGR